MELRELQTGDEQAFLKAVEAFQGETEDFRFAIGFEPRLGFETFRLLQEQWSRGENLPLGFVPSTYYVGVVDGMVVGRVFIRHELNDFLERIGGHVGYGVVPGFRRKGYATEMLRLALPLCSSLGLEKILVTCDVDNVGSRKVIENCGGIFAGISDEPEIDVQKRKYWIETPSL